jgi:pyruvate formate lyase activating enzyme
MRCDYCHNPNIVLEKGNYSFEQLIPFLKQRENLLKGVVLSGGEATLNKEIYDICKYIKSMGFKIKLDTNGLKPQVLEKLIKNNLLDFIALDFKTSKTNFFEITKNKEYEKLTDSLKLLIDSNLDFEVRTTYHNSLFSKNDINEILEVLQKYKYTKTYYIQKCLNSVPTLSNISKNTITKEFFREFKDKYSFKIKYRNFDY